MMKNLILTFAASVVLTPVLSSFGHAENPHFICYGSERGLCLSLDETQETHTAIDGSSCHTSPSEFIAHGGGFTCTKEGLESCRKLIQASNSSFGANPGIGSDGICYNIGG